MEYNYLIGHKIKCTFFGNEENKDYEYTGYVSNVIIGNLNIEKILIILDNGESTWFTPRYYSVENLKIEILDKEVKSYTKFTRFEIMEI